MSKERNINESYTGGSDVGQKSYTGGAPSGPPPAMPSTVNPAPAPASTTTPTPSPSSSQST